LLLKIINIFKNIKNFNLTYYLFLLNSKSHISYCKSLKIIIIVLKNLILLNILNLIIYGYNEMYITKIGNIIKIIAISYSFKKKSKTSAI